MSESSSPFTRPGFIASAALVFILIVAGVVLTVLNLSGRDDDAPAPIPATPTAAASSSAPAAAGTCPASTFDDARLVSAPVEQWGWDGHNAYPITAAGPAGTSDDDARLPICFAHSQLGAATAASTMVAMSANPDVDAQKAAILTYTTSDRREEALEGITAGGSTADYSSTLAIKGVQIISFDESTAVIGVASQIRATNGKTTLLNQQFVLNWVTDDWKLNLADSAAASGSGLLPDLTGYTLWSE